MYRCNSDYVSFERIVKYIPLFFVLDLDNSINHCGLVTLPQLWNHFPRICHVYIWNSVGSPVFNINYISCDLFVWQA